MSRYPRSSAILSWLSNLPGTEPDCNTTSHHDAPGEPGNNPAVSSYSNKYDNVPPYFKSNWELLSALPAPADMMKIAPYLPTSYFTPSMFDVILPDRESLPLPKSMFKASSQKAIEAKYSRILDLRERLRVEEITLEMQTDMDRLYLKPAAYHSAQERLRNVRSLIIRACQSLSYIEDECAAHGLELDTLSINDRRIANRPPEHPFHIVAMYFKPGALEEFSDFQIYIDSHKSDIKVSRRTPVTGESIKATHSDAGSSSSSNSSHSIAHLNFGITNFATIKEFTMTSTPQISGSTNGLMPNNRFISSNRLTPKPLYASTAGRVTRSNHVDSSDQSSDSDVRINKRVKHPSLLPTSPFSSQLSHRKRFMPKNRFTPIKQPMYHRTPPDTSVSRRTRFHSRHSPYQNERGWSGQAVVAN